jgi:hypothetical protein
MNNESFRNINPERFLFYFKVLCDFESISHRYFIYLVWKKLNQMKYSRHLFSFLLFILFQNSFKAQSLSPEVISSNGDFYTNTAGSVSFTIGETVVETFNGTSNILTQGFQQPFVDVTGIPESQNSNAVSAFPNPFKNEMFLNFGKMETGNYTISVYDLTGKQIVNEKTTVSINNSAYRLSLVNIDDGIYVVKISNEKRCDKSIKIIKQN